MDGSGKVRSLTSQSKGGPPPSAVANGALRPGHVVIPGVGETTIEAAINAGLLPQGWTPQQGFKQPVAGDNLTAGGHTQKGAQKATEGQRDGAEVDTDEATFASQKAAAEEAGRLLDAIDQSHGAAVTDAAISEVVETGYVPDELPEGVEPSAVDKIVAGYVAATNATLAETGASVPILMETLSDDELREARSAAVSNDPVKMKHLGRIAMTRLEQLPQTDPDGFREMLEGMTPAERKMLTQDDNSGQWVLRIPGRQPMSYGAAVRAGIIRV